MRKVFIAVVLLALIAISLAIRSLYMYNLIQPITSSLPTPHNKTIVNLAFNLDGTLLVSGYDDGTISRSVLHDLSNLQVIKPLQVMERGTILTTLIDGKPYPI